ncbi:MAG TPA: hypothetical protein VM096_00015 [Vicinamibacterales bacterium]|nr:hypothetical protein [Vicinamibacterales bacterium]
MKVKGAVAAALVAAQAMIGLPDQVRRDLDTSCSGWRLAPVLPEIEAEIHTRTPSWPVNMIPGDFNGDRKSDVAVLVECKGTVELTVFLSSGARFTKHVLEPPQLFDARQFLHLIRGEYEHDAVGVEYEAIGGHAWLFRDGRFQSVRY